VEDAIRCRIETRVLMEKAAPVEDALALRDELRVLNLELAELQGESPLVPVTVDVELVGQVISGRMGIPVGKMLGDDPGKPAGVFLLVGPPGVGKTETALALSDPLCGGEHNVMTIDISEFQEPHAFSTLNGSPPGYVG
jgi:type VI secretion system protein VasG